VTAFCGFTEISIAADLTNIGTLFAFALVCIGVVVLRMADPARPRPFRCPWVPVIPAAGVMICVALMLSLPHVTWVRFVIWLFIGLAIYFLYGIDHSALFFGNLKRNPALVSSVTRTRNIIGAVCLAITAAVFYGATTRGRLGEWLVYAIGADQTSRPYAVLTLSGILMLGFSLTLFYKAKRVNVKF
jgi:hypothetical protein